MGGAVKNRPLTGEILGKDSESPARLAYFGFSIGVSVTATRPLWARI